MGATSPFTLDASYVDCVHAMGTGCYTLFGSKLKCSASSILIGYALCVHHRHRYLAILGLDLKSPGTQVSLRSGCVAISLHGAGWPTDAACVRRPRRSPGRLAPSTAGPSMRGICPCRLRDQPTIDVLCSGPVGPDPGTCRARSRDVRSRIQGPAEPDPVTCRAGAEPDPANLQSRIQRTCRAGSSEPAELDLGDAEASENLRGLRAFALSTGPGGSWVQP